MCLAIPGEVIKIINKSTVVVDFMGVQKDIVVDLIDEVAIGDYVIVHAGYAINKLDVNEAKKTLRLLEEVNESIR